MTWTALALLFCLFPVTEARASADEETTVVLQNGDELQTLTMAEYLPGAVSAEMPVLFGQEALKAQAVAIRTFVLYGPRHDGADVCADSGCCLSYFGEDELRARWGEDYDKYISAVREAVSATDGEILTYGGSPIQAVFHASSLGATEDSAALWSELPYLKSVSSPETEASVPGLVTEVRFTPEELCERLSITPVGEPSSWLGAIEHDSAGRVASFEIGGRVFTGAEIRGVLSLRSTAFSVTFRDGLFLFTVSGYGHGVGMSQHGANLLAGEGWSYDAILMHYYPGAVIQRPSRPSPV